MNGGKLCELLAKPHERATLLIIGRRSHSRFVPAGRVTSLTRIQSFEPLSL